MKFESGHGMLYQIDSEGNRTPIGEVVDGYLDVSEVDSPPNMSNDTESVTRAFRELSGAVTMTFEMLEEVFEEFQRLFVDPFQEYLESLRLRELLEAEIEGLYPQPTPPKEYARLRTTSKKGVYNNAAKQSIRQAKAHSHQKVLRNHPYQRRLYR